MKRFTIIILSFTLLFPVMAQQALELSLSEAMEYASEHNTSVKNARLGVDIAKKRVWESTATGLPQVNASVGYQDMLKLPVSLIPAEFFGGEPGTFQEISFGTQHNASADITVSQLVFNGPYIIGLKAARSYQLMQEQNFQKVLVDVKAQVSEAYYFALLSQDLLDVMTASVANMNKTFTDTWQMVVAGLVAETEADQLKIALSRLENSERNVKRQHETSMNLLRLHLGVGMDVPVRLTDSLAGIMEAVNIDALTNSPFSVENNLDYKSAQTNLLLSQLQWNLQKSAYLPSLTAFYTRNESAMRNEFDFLSNEGSWYPSSILGFTLSIPITTSGMQNAKVQQARMTYEQNQNSVEMLQRSLEMEAVQSNFDLITAYENYLVEKMNIDLANKILDHTLIRYSEGLATSMEVTQASNQLLQAETNYSSALVDILNAKVRLDKIMSRF